MEVIQVPILFNKEEKSVYFKTDDLANVFFLNTEVFANVMRKTAATLNPDVLDYGEKEKLEAIQENILKGIPYELPDLGFLTESQCGFTDGITRTKFLIRNNAKYIPLKCTDISEEAMTDNSGLMYKGKVDIEFDSELKEE